MPLRPIHEAARDGDLATIKQELDVDVNGADSSGWTPLAHAATAANGLAAVKLLIERKATIESRTGSDATPLHIACANWRLDSAKHLLDCKADINARDQHG